MPDKRILVDYDFQGVARAKNLPQPVADGEAATKGYVDQAVENVAPGQGAYEHVQSVASTNWVVNHNFGRSVAVSVLSDGGVEVFANVVHVSSNQVRVQFSVPQTGRAICS